MAGALSGFFMVAGAAFMLLAAVGVVRMPDVFMRLQATTKALTFGVGGFMIGVALHLWDLGAVLRLLITVGFIFLTVPIAAHVIARAAYRVGAEFWSGSLLEDLPEAPEKQAPAVPELPEGDSGDPQGT
ncbi:MAG: monovalent cation/H(+) antiporter subunit G [Bryobacteraceae bacterium]|nr:monovalent cation/H(+) antiporter subunit G [Bryobacteraceae bacterium]